MRRKEVTAAMSRVLYAASVAAHLRNFHIPYITRLIERGDEVWTLCSGGFAPEGIARSVDLPLKKRLLSPGNLAAAFRLARLLKAERFDLICVHTSLAAFYVRLAVLLAGKGDTRVICMVHGYLFDEQTAPLRRALLLAAEKLCRRVTDRVIVMNECDRLLAEKYRLAPEIVSVPGVGVDFSRLRSADRDASREALGLRETDVLLLYPAEFSARKNQRFLLRALTKLPENVFLALPGEGALREACRREAENVGVSARVFLPGQVGDLSSWLAAADICVSASRYEGLPFNVMEGMYAGRPIVASRIKGHTDLVTDGVGGFLFGFGDEEEFIDCIRTLMKDPELRRIMGEKNRRLVRKFGREAVEAEVMAAMFEEKQAVAAR